jgi:hypothetical protein
MNQLFSKQYVHSKLENTFVQKKGEQFTANLELLKKSNGHY